MQRRALSRLKKRGQTNPKFKLGKARGQGCGAQWSRDLEEKTAKPSALHIEYAPRGIPLLFKLMGHSDGSENRNVQRQSKRGGSNCKLLKVVLVSPYTGSKRGVDEASYVAALSIL